MSIASNMKSAFPKKVENAKEIMKFVEKHSRIVDKSLAGTLMSTLTTMKFDGSRTMHEHIIGMINIAAKLTYLGMKMNENFLV